MYSLQKMQPFFATDLLDFKIYHAQFVEGGLVVTHGYPRSAAISEQKIEVNFIPNGARYSRLERGGWLSLPIETGLDKYSLRHYMRQFHMRTCDARHIDVRELVTLVWQALGPLATYVLDAFRVSSGFVALMNDPKVDRLQILRISIDPFKTGSLYKSVCLLDGQALSENEFEAETQTEAAIEELYLHAHAHMIDHRNACMLALSYRVADSVFVRFMKSERHGDKVVSLIPMCSWIDGAHTVDWLIEKTTLELAAEFIRNRLILQSIVEKCAPIRLEQWGPSPLETAFLFENGNALLIMSESCDPAELLQWWMAKGEWLRSAVAFDDGEIIIRATLARNAANSAINEIRMLN